LFLPLHDGLALKHLRRAFATLLVIAINIFVYVAGTNGLLGDTNRIEIALGLIPAVLTGDARISPDLALVPAYTTLITSLFLHAGFFHLAGNKMFLWVFGDNVEDAMGHVRFLIYYLVCGICASLVYVYIFPSSRNPLVGASGAISGVAVAYLILYPRSRIFGLLLNWIPAYAPSFVMIGLWALYQIYFAVAGGDSSIGWWAHAGGMISGALLLPIFRHWQKPPEVRELSEKENPDEPTAERPF